MNNFILVGNGLFAKNAYEAAINHDYNPLLVFYSTNKSQVGYWNPANKKKGTKFVSVDDINSDDVKELILEFAPQVKCAFVIGWIQILKKPILDLVRWYGFHPTKLPYGRGNAPIPNTIIDKNPLKETAITFFKLEEGIDNGDILFQSPLKLNKRETSSNLYHNFLNCMSQSFPEVLRLAFLDNVPLKKQIGNVVKYPKRTPVMSKISFSKMKVDKIDKLIRALTDPFPNAFTIVKRTKEKVRFLNSIRVKISVNNFNYEAGYVVNVDGNLSLIATLDHSFIEVISDSQLKEGDILE